MFSQSGCTIFDPHQQNMEVSIALHPHQHLACSIFKIVTNLMNVQWYFIVHVVHVICLSLMHVKVLLDFCVCSFVSVHFFIGFH